MLGWLRRTPTVTLDFDWSYRRLAPAVVRMAEHGIMVVQARATALVATSVRAVAVPFIDLHRPNAFLGRTWSTSRMALGVMVILLAYLLNYYVLGA